MRNVEHREKNLSSVHKQSLEELESEKKGNVKILKFWTTGKLL